MPFLSRQTEPSLRRIVHSGMHARRHRILEHDDSRDRKNVVRLQRVEQRRHVRNHARRPRVLREVGVMRFVIEPELVLHVDDERVDLRRVGRGDQLCHPLAALRRPAVHVERAHRRPGRRIDLTGRLRARPLSAVRRVRPRRYSAAEKARNKSERRIP